MNVVIQRAATVALLILSTAALPAREPYPACSQSHAGKSYRAKRLATDGDTKVLRSIAGHVTIYARQRYGLQGLVTDADAARAQKEMYDFLSWKLGNPSLVGAQWVSAGYQHFDHHADEAAAALLGMDLPGPGPQVRLPKEMSAWLKQQVDSLAKSDSSVAAICAGMGDSTFVGFACEALVPVVLAALERAADRAIDRIGISNAALMGKNKYDITDAEIELLEQVRRNPPQTASSGARSGSPPVPAPMPGQVRKPRP